MAKSQHLPNTAIYSKGLKCQNNDAKIMNLFWSEKILRTLCVQRLFFGLEKSAKGKGWGDQKTKIKSITSLKWKLERPGNPGTLSQEKTVFVAFVLSSLIFFLAQQTSSNIQAKGFAPTYPVLNYTISVKKIPPQIVALVKNSEGGAWRNTWWRGKYASINIIIPFWKWHAHHWNF